jgi:hypothetical protein
MDQDQFGDNIRQDLFKSFVQKYSGYSPEELSGIIMKYINYEPEPVKAALYVAVEKGFISYDRRELLWKQMAANLEALNKPIKNYRWENNNAFIEYFSNLTDEQIYDIIDDRDEKATDVFHAILSIALARELISEDDFNTYYANAKSGRAAGMFDKIIRISQPDTEVLSDEELDEQRGNFWKCPKCNELVGMEFGVCWNCQTEMPEVVEHPDRKEVGNEIKQKSTWHPVKSGLYLILGGLIIVVHDQIRHHHSFHILSYIFGGFFALMGIGFIVFGLFFYSDSKD